MKRDEILKRLGDLCSLSERALELLEQDGITADESQELRDIVRRLKKDIRAEQMRTSPVTVQQKMDPEESACYLPAIHEAYSHTGLSNLRVDAKRGNQWHGTVEAVTATLKYYLHQLESQNE